jgi:hypothetical protein
MRGAAPQAPGLRVALAATRRARDLRLPPRAGGVHATPMRWRSRSSRASPSSRCCPRPTSPRQDPRMPEVPGRRAHRRLYTFSPGDYRAIAGHLGRARWRCPTTRPGELQVVEGMPDGGASTTSWASPRPSPRLRAPRSSTRSPSGSPRRRARGRLALTHKGRGSQDRPSSPQPRYVSVRSERSEQRALGRTRCGDVNAVSASSRDVDAARKRDDVPATLSRSVTGGVLLHAAGTVDSFQRVGARDWCMASPAVAYMAADLATAPQQRCSAA